MKVFNTSEAKNKLYEFMHYVSKIYKPIYIKGKKSKVVLI